VRATGTTKNSPIANPSPPATAPAHVPAETAGASSGWVLSSEIRSARKPRESDSASATTPRTTGARAQRRRRADEASGNDSTSIAPLWRRTATAHAEAPRIMTPSMTAWPPMGASRAEDRAMPNGSAGRAARWSEDQAEPRWRRAARRWKRSTRPPVSTSFCRPV
jgi:hypothetical protein